MCMRNIDLKAERDFELIQSYLNDQHISDLLEIIPDRFEEDIKDALKEIIHEYNLIYINQFNEICFES